MIEASVVPVQHPLVKLVLDTQAILAKHADPMGPSKADTIDALNAIYDGRRDVGAIADHNYLVRALSSARCAIKSTGYSTSDKDAVLLRVDCALTAAGAA